MSTDAKIDEMKQRMMQLAMLAAQAAGLNARFALDDYWGNAAIVERYLIERIDANRAQ